LKLTYFLPPDIPSLVGVAALLGQFGLANAFESARVGNVIAHMADAGVDLRWQPIDDFGNEHLILDLADYNLYEESLLESGNVTDLVAVAPGGNLAVRESATATCFGSGSWAKHATIIGVAGVICDSFAYGLAEGTVQIVRIWNDLNGNRLRNEANDPMMVYVRFVVGRTQVFTKDTCNQAVKTLVSKYCQGKNQ